MSLSESLALFPLLLFVPVIFLNSIAFGYGPGIYSTFASAALAAYFFIPPLFTFNVGPKNWFALSIFVLIGVIISLVTDALRRALEQLEQSEASQALLLREFAHRTKNDLALLTSSLSLQANMSADGEVKKSLHAAVSRILVVSQVQDKLRMDKNGGRVDLEDYVSTLCKSLGDLLRDIRPIAVRVRCETHDVAASFAVTTGLIVNELVTNCLKYAYPAEDGGIIDVQIDRLPGQFIIIVRDDGVGYKEDAKAGLGSKLVRLLAKQHGGKVERLSAEKGSSVAVTLLDA